VAMGCLAGFAGQGSGAVAIGFQAGNTQQGSNSVAVGNSAGQNTQGQNAVAVGNSAGQNTQGSGAVAIGYQSGYTGQAPNTVAMGVSAGYFGQGSGAAAIGFNAGTNTQGANAIAIGNNAGNIGQGSGAVAIGFNAGNTQQGVNAIAIGTIAGQTAQGARSIVINASGVAFSTTTANATFIRPMRVSNTVSAMANLVYFNPSTYELLYSGAATAAATIDIKTFVIDHPTNANKYLVHACLEGPESGVYYRGEGQIVNNLHTTIHLPAYVEHLATGFTIQITPIYSGEMIKPLYTSRVKGNSFTVYGENCEFFWHVTGKRGDINVEPSKATTTVKGSGPYRWI